MGALAPALLLLPLVAGVAFQQSTRLDVRAQLSLVVQLTCAALLAHFLTERYAVQVLGLADAVFHTRRYWAPHNDLAWVVTGPFLAYIVTRGLHVPSAATSPLREAAPLVAALALLLTSLFSRPACFLLGWAASLWLSAPPATAFGPRALLVVHAAGALRDTARAHRAGVSLLLLAQVLAGAVALQFKPFLHGIKHHTTLALTTIAFVALVHVRCNNTMQPKQQALFAGVLGALVLPVYLLLPLAASFLNMAMRFAEINPDTIALATVPAALVLSGTVVWSVTRASPLWYLLLMRDKDTSVLCPRGTYTPL